MCQNGIFYRTVDENALTVVFYDLWAFADKTYLLIKEYHQLKKKKSCAPHRSRIELKQ